MRVVKRAMIGPAGTVDLHVTSTTGYEERQQWGGGEDAITVLFYQWLNACESSPRLPYPISSVLPHPFPAFGRHELLLSV